MEAMQEALKYLREQNSEPQWHEWVKDTNVPIVPAKSSGKTVGLLMKKDARKLEKLAEELMKGTR